MRAFDRIGWAVSAVQGMRGRRRGRVLAVAAMCLALVLLVPTEAFALPTINFPDANLNAAVHTRLGKPLADPIYASDLATMGTLSAGSHGITYLDGLEHATALTSLDLSGNSIATVTPIGSLTGLRSLDLTQNQIVDASPLSALSQLTYLRMGQDPLATITPLAGLTNLQSLYLFNDGVVDVTPLAGLTNLTTLHLAHNHIIDITPLHNLTKLESLYLHDNAIASGIAPVSNMTSLTVLYLSSNPIATITPVHALTKLQALSLSSDHVADISPLQGLTNLTYLDLGDNHLITSVAPLQGATQMKTLYLYTNQISDISALGGMNDLEQLVIDGNQVADVSALRGKTHLSILGLSDNQLWDITPLKDLPVASGYVYNNWLDFTPGSGASQTVDTWLGNSAYVVWLPQRIGGSIVGTVTCAGKPLAGVTMGIAHGPRVTTGADGSYQLRVAPTGEQWLAFSKAYYHAVTTTLAVSPSTTYTVSETLTPFRLPPTISRSPSSSKLTYKRKKGIATFVLGATLHDARGAVAGAYLWLQKSTNGKKWATLYKLKTSSSGKVVKAFSAKKKSTAYYRWYTPTTIYDSTRSTSKQKVVVK